MQRELTPGRIMVLTASVLAVLAVAWVAVQIRSLFALVIIGMIFAAAIEPLVTRLRRRGLTRVQAILTIYIAILALIAFTAVLIVPPLLNQASNLIDNVPDILQDLRKQAADSPNGFINTTVWEALLRAERAWNQFRSNPPIEGQQAVSLVNTTLSALLSIVTVLMVAFYWLTEKATIKRLVITLFPAHRREMVSEIWETIEFKLGGWTRGQLMLCLLIGTVSTVAYFALSLPFWLALGIFAGITEIVPFIGPIVGGGTAVVIALTDSWQKALVVLVFVVVLQQMESHLLVPRVMNHAVGMSPLTVILAVLVGARLGGILGSILAIPVGAMIQVLLSVLLRGRIHPEELKALEEEEERKLEAARQAAKVRPKRRRTAPGKEPAARAKPAPGANAASSQPRNSLGEIASSAVDLVSGKSGTSEADSR